MKRGFVLFIALLIFQINGYSQTVSQQVISSSGNYFKSNKYNVNWTMGEVVIDTYFSNGMMLTQGFHQPNILKEIVDEDPVEFFNGFSPNNDGYNDYWNIPLLNKYPLNRVTITNRWGSVVWTKENYNNRDILFIGQNLEGEELADGTYFYSIIYGLYIKKGWVFIKR